LFALKRCIYILKQSYWFTLVYIHFFQIWNMWRLFIYVLVFFLHYEKQNNHVHSYPFLLWVTVKPAHVVTSIKQSPVLKGHLFLVLVIENFIWIEPLLRGHLSYIGHFVFVRKPEYPEENHRPDTCHWQTLSHNVVSSTTLQIQYCSFLIVMQDKQNFNLSLGKGLII
jgi:hypothetical protein